MTLWDGRSYIFYYDFQKNGNKFYTVAQMETAPIYKFCIYDLDKLSNLISKTWEKLSEKPEFNKWSDFPSLYNFTKENGVVFCPFDDNKSYSNFEWLDNNKIRFTKSDIWTDVTTNNWYDITFPNWDIYESNWDGTDMKKVWVMKDGKMILLESKKDKHSFNTKTKSNPQRKHNTSSNHSSTNIHLNHHRKRTNLIMNNRNRNRKIINLNHNKNWQTKHNDLNRKSS